MVELLQGPFYRSVRTFSINLDHHHANASVAASRFSTLAHEKWRKGRKKKKKKPSMYVEQKIQSSSGFSEVNTVCT